MRGWAITLIVLGGFAAAADEREEFEMKVRPLLARNCYACHTDARMGGLRLDSREAIVAGGKSGPAITAGDPEKSLLIDAVTHKRASLKMPPSGALKAEEIAILSTWIKTGAYWPVNAGNTGRARGSITAEQRAFWSFQPVKEPALPVLRDMAGVQSPVDRFVLARLEAKGLKPAPPAARRTLIRRASLDLTGLPPAPEEVEAFEADRSPDAFAKVVDRLLASPRYGERWGRHWLDVARYADDKLNSTEDEPYANAFRYRNWVIGAFNDDMPYDTFLKAQIAGDQMPSEDPMKFLPGLGFFALSPEFQDERVDALSRGFLGLTVACAQCHDHKFDPIPTRDYYALQGVFESSELHQRPLADAREVEEYTSRKKAADKQEERIKKFYQQQTGLVGQMMAANTARYLLATRGLATGEALDAESLARWKAYLGEPRKEHPYLRHWMELDGRRAGNAEFENEAKRLETFVLDVLEEKQRVDHENEIRLGLDPKRNDLANASLVSLARDKYVLWRDLFAAGTKDAAGFFSTPDGIYYYGRGKVDRFLSVQSQAYVRDQKALLDELKKAIPQQYPFLHTLKDRDKPADIRVSIRGERNNKGEIAPRAFLSVLADGAPKPFTHGSGRLDLAEAIASPSNPLTARVIVNRVWMIHFGRGLVNTPGNFGQLGERPTHPELLDYLAARFVKNGWSLKKLHRELMLSATYQLGNERIEANMAADPDNSLYWRHNRRRMDIETIRDSILYVAGTLDATPAAKPLRVDDETNRKRTVYCQISRRKTEPLLSLFDFPNPNSTSEKRIPTNIPPQRLFFMNSRFVEQQAQALAGRLPGEPPARIAEAYRLLFARKPDSVELRAAQQFLGNGTWTQYARVLLSSNEFLFVD